MIKIYKRTIHGGRGYDTGDGCDIEDKVLDIFGFIIVLSIKIETNKNIYNYSPFGYKWISKTNA